MTASTTIAAPSSTDTVRQLLGEARQALGAASVIGLGSSKTQANAAHLYSLLKRAVDHLDEGNLDEARRATADAAFWSTQIAPRVPTVNSRSRLVRVSNKVAVAHYILSTANDLD